MATPLPLPPFGTSFLDPATGGMSEVWRRYYLALETALDINAAPKDAQYWVSTSNAALSNERNLGAVATGYLKITTTLGIAVPSSVASVPASDVSSGAALTRTNDTNVTVTLGGTPATALLATTSLTLGWSGTLAVARGGTAADNTTQTYTPALTNVANVTASTAYPCQYLRVGSAVTVSGKVEIDPTAGATLTQLGISLPIASNFGAAEECGGTGVAPVASYAGAVVADAANNRAELQFTTAVDVANRAWAFTFTYQVVP